jgi:hypothetical protein
MTEKKMQRYSISVSARTYDRLRAVVEGSLAAFVGDIVVSALDDPAIMERLIDRCHRCRRRRRGGVALAVVS